ncbi:uncharacterized protein F4812DRAFT_441326 [Daldinia caldariorum]|uniref:uncharacterized protein n=1 Tax=Daldinia caldariorum TaxID=326644 RepID=UPI0020087A34|nr:uncharacterized protein F4812DRAFT_441326 [Daldinia caldariorum]KAI1465018.1 hypothetical protein F4812DRAFT_441326 [Daldinia caldariorum]
MSLNEFKVPDKPRPRSDKSGETSSQPWTAARCQRLLRPLLSRIASLRKDAATSQLSARDDELEQKGRVAAAEQQPNANCEWLRPRKRVRLTYSQRRPTNQDGQSMLSKDPKGTSTTKNIQRGEGRTIIPGEIVPATPVLRRARGYVVPSPSAASGQSKREQAEQPAVGCRRDQYKDLEKRLASLRAQSTSNKHNDLESIYKSLKALLKATRHTTSRGRGPRSFLDMCLRKVPSYIEELEAWERKEAEQSGSISTLDDVDTSAEIYNYLESIGTNQIRGWKHLRIVVRADGINAVKQGVLEGLFGDDFSQLLIDLCIRIGALSEAEELVAALSDRQYPSPTAAGSSFAELGCFRPLLILWNFSNKHGHTSFLLRHYSLLLSNGSLPKDWLATQEFERVWALAARHLSVVEAADDAVAFMNYSVSLLCRRRRTLAGGNDATRSEKEIHVANKQTLISALTMLAAMSSLGEIELHTANVSEAEIAKIGFIGNRLRHILRSCIADLELSKSTRSGLGNDLLHLAYYISSSDARADNDISSRLKFSIEQAWRQHAGDNSARSNRMRHHLTDISSFMSSVARSCGRGLNLASHNCLDMLFGQLTDLGLDQEILDSMKGIAAFSLAQQTNNIKDFIYAEKLACNQHSGAGDGARTRPLFSGYRWEETIGEWVTVSPRRLPPARTRQLRSSSRSDRGRVIDGGEQRATQPGVSIYGEAESVPGLEIEGTVPKTPGAEHVNTRKRAHSCSQGDKPQAATGPRRSKSFVVLQAAKPAHSSLDDELGSDKENSNCVIRKKPRRSIDKKTLLGSKLRSSLGGLDSIGIPGGDCSDDELCM